jgi:hypothetical protein
MLIRNKTTTIHFAYMCAHDLFIGVIYLAKKDYKVWFPGSALKAKTRNHVSAF